MEQEPAYQDVAMPDVLSPWDSPLHYISLQDPVQQQPKQQQQGNSGKGFICIWLDAFCLFQGQIIQTLVVPSQWTPGWSSILCQPTRSCMQQQRKKQQ
jgi:hypothetical protein